MSLDGRVQVFLALAAQGAEAVAQAIRSGQVRIRMPRMARTPVTSAGTFMAKHRTLGTIMRHKPVGMANARLIRQRLAAGELPDALAAEFQVKVETIGYIDRQLIYKDETAQ